MHRIARAKTKLEQTVAAVVVFVPPAATLSHCLLNGGPDFVSFGLCVLMYLLSGFGITIGNHRYFTHRSFEVVHPWFEYVLGILGLLAIEGLLSQWIADHRLHHAFSDAEGDPHSPHMYGSGAIARVKGFACSHMGWFFVTQPALITGALKNDPVIRRLDRLLIPVAIAGVVLPGCIGALLRGSLEHFYADVVWGGFARICFVQHAT